jgi:hypothetical protein
MVEGKLRKLKSEPKLGKVTAGTAKKGKGLFHASRPKRPSAYELLAPRMKTVKGPGGRPKKVYDIDWLLVMRLAKIHCTPMEISWAVQVPYQTIIADDQFEGIYKKGWEEGKMSLRRMQWQAAKIQSKEGKNCGMLIWMGKQILGQKDFVRHEHEGPDGAPIPIKTDRSDLTRLNVQELETLRSLIEKATVTKDLVVQ